MELELDLEEKLEMLRKVKTESRYKGQKHSGCGEERVPSQGGRDTACGETWERHLTFATSPGSGWDNPLVLMSLCPGLASDRIPSALQPSVGQVARVDVSSKVEVVWADNSKTIILPQVRLPRPRPLAT